MTGNIVRDGSLTSADIAASGTNGLLIGAFSYNPPSLAANSCMIAESSAAAVLGVQPGDHVILNLDESMEDGLQASPLLAINPNVLRFRLCNTTESAIDGLSRTYSYIVVR